MIKTPSLMRVDTRFYQAYLEFKARKEVVTTTEFQRKLIEMLQNNDKRLRFFK